MSSGYNPTPYRGRRTDSHKRAGGGKPPKKSSGKASFIETLIAGVIFLAFPAGLVLGATAWLLHGYGVI